MPLDFSKIPVEEGPNLLQRITTPILDQLPKSWKERVETDVHPGLNDSWLTAAAKGFGGGVLGAITPAHVAAAATLSPELIGANALTKSAALGGNVLNAVQGGADVIDPNKTPIERVLGAGNAALSAYGGYKLGQDLKGGYQAWKAAQPATSATQAATAHPTPSGNFPYDLSNIQGVQARLNALDEMGQHVPLNPQEWEQVNKLRMQSGNTERLNNLLKGHTEYLNQRAKLNEAMAPKPPELDYEAMAASATPADVQSVNAKVTSRQPLSKQEEAIWKVSQAAEKRQVDHWKGTVDNANRVEDIQRAQQMRDAAIAAGLDPKTTTQQTQTAKGTAGKTVKATTKFVEPEADVAEAAAGPRGAGPGPGNPRPYYPATPPPGWQDPQAGPQGPIQGQVVPGPASPGTPSSAMAPPVMEGEIIPPAQGPQAPLGLPPGPDGGVPQASAPAPAPTPSEPLGLEPTPAEAVRLAQAGEQAPTSSKFFDRLPKLGEKAKTPKTTAKFNAAVEQATPAAPAASLDEDVERFRQAQTAQRGAEFDAKGRGTVPEATAQQVDRLVKERFGGGTVAPPDESPAQAARRAEMKANARTPGPPIGVPPTLEPTGPGTPTPRRNPAQELADAKARNRRGYAILRGEETPTPKTMDISDPEMGKMFGIDVAPGTGAKVPAGEPMPTLTEPMGYGKTGGPMMEKQQAYWQDAKPAYAAGKINKGDLMVAGKASAAENAAKGAAIDARAAAADNAALLEKLQNASPEERASLIERMKKETGAADPTMALRLGLGIAGGVTGTATDPVGSVYGEHTPTTRALSTLGLGTLGFMAPGALGKVINSPEGVQARGDLLKRVGQGAINIHNTGMLSPLSLGKKVLGDVGGMASAGAETGTANALLRAVGQEPIERGSILKALAQKAPEIAAAGKEAALSPSYQELSGTDNLVSKLTQGKMNPLSWVGRGMSGATVATKKALEEAGYSPLEQQYYTLTSRPQTDTGSGAYDMWRKSKLMQLASPFARMGINRLERGVERSPFGLAQLLKASDPQERAKIVARSLLGTGVAGAAYEATPEDFVKKHPIGAGLVGAATAGYGVPVLAAMAMKTHAKSPGASAVKTIAKDIPGMQTLEYASRSPEELGRTAISGFTNVTKPIADITNPGEVETKGPGLNPLQRLTYRALANIPGVKGMLPKKGVSIEGLDPALLMEILK